MSLKKTDDFLMLIEDYVFKYDLKSMRFDFLKKQNAVICENVDINDMINTFFNYHEIQESYKKIFLSFLEEIFKETGTFKKGIKLLTTSHNAISLEFNCTVTSKKIAKYSFTPSKIIGLIKINVDTNKKFAIDPLTGTLYVEDIYKLAKTEIEIKKKQNMVMIVSEIVGLNKVIENFGQDVYEKILIEVSSKINDHFKLNGYTGRIGKNTFLTIIYGVYTKQDVWQLNKVLYDNLFSLNNYNIYREQVPYYTVSGIAKYPKNGYDFETVFRNACRALQRATEKKMAAFVIFNQQMHSSYNDITDLYTNEINKFCYLDDEKEFINIIVKNLSEQGSFTRKMDIILKILGQHYDLDRVNVFRVNEEKKEILKLKEWINDRYDDIYPVSDVPFEVYKKARGLFLSNSFFITENIQTLINIDYNFFKFELDNNTKSLILYEGTAKGFTVIVSLHKCKNYLNLSASQINTLSIVLKVIISNIIQGLESHKQNKILYYDPLTNVFNGTKFIIEGNELLKKNSKYSNAIITTDFYHFKYINEKFGFKAGDQILIDFANLLKKTLKHGSIYARLDADKFLILIPNCNKQDVETFLKTIHKEIKYFNNTDNTKFNLYLLSGVCLFNNTDLTLSSLIDNAKFARSTIPFINKSQYAFYEEKILKNYIEQNEIENRMESALDNNEFKVYLQPKFNTRTKTVYGAEALIRWHISKDEILLPGKFIPIFEKNGFITKIDLLVLETACKLIRKWLDNNQKVIPISVNLSRIHIESDKYYQRVIQILKKYDVPTKYIELEITESIFVDNIVALHKSIESFRNLGISISIDDFGSGYSNLNLLTKIDVDIIKLDRSLSIIDNEKDRIIVESIVDLATKLNVSTVSEGIETEEQIKFLDSIGCNNIQGFIFSKPIPIDEFEEIYINVQK